MRRARQLLVALLMPLWLVAMCHCQLEAAGLLPTLLECAPAEAGSDHCSDTACEGEQADAALQAPGRLVLAQLDHDLDLDLPAAGFVWAFPESLDPPRVCLTRAGADPWVIPDPQRVHVGLSARPPTLFL